MPNSADNTMEFDAQSGRTLAPPGPWQQILRERRNLKNPPANPPRPSEPRQSTNRPPGTFAKIIVIVPEILPLLMLESN
ncbi:hypothetical protein HPB47_004868 [Ixodes persulcatus]|uniref:Uncharacterized protein n=1 Tax=Ixodes persulcatus TaxID=34615 RepID=A0AC60PEK0_IXOPE|nr:hypothetical protein HPB47_004868 [Ixodes persulcatus]